MTTSSKKSVKKLDKKAVVGELKNLALVSAGVIAGSLGGRMIDKMVKLEEGTTGMNPKAFVRPGLLLGAGVFGATQIKSPELRMLSAGVGVSGVLSLAKVITKKDLLAGLDNIEGLGNSLMESMPSSVYLEPLNMSIDRFNPELPSLMASPVDYGTSNGYGEDISGTDEMDGSPYMEII